MTPKVPLLTPRKFKFIRKNREIPKNYWEICGRMFIPASRAINLGGSLIVQS